MKTITLKDFLTEAQIKQIIKLRTAQKICHEVITPNLEDINRKLGQENDPKFLGYLCEYALIQGSS